MINKGIALMTAMLLIHSVVNAEQSLPSSYQKALDAAKQILQKEPVKHVSDELSYIRTLSLKPDIEDSFHTVNICSIANRMQLWQKYLPDVHVRYALKTNPDKVISKVLASLGAGFDCASIGEMQQVLQQGVNPQQIIFSHPRKPVKEIIFAEQNKIKLMVFDSTEELDKMMRFAPSSQYLLRIKTHDEHSETPLSSKFGASMAHAYKILDDAFMKKAPIVGISFHVGSNNVDETSFTKALSDAAKLFNYSEKKWHHPLTIIDLGGGWPGDNDARFIKFANTVNAGLQRYFSKKVQVIAEPGRFFATKTTTAAVRIIGVEPIHSESGLKYAYYLSNGVYGLFAASLYFQYDPKKIAMEDWSFHPLIESKEQAKQLYPSIFWGPTCDSGDKILENVLFPKMQTNEFIYSQNVGSYTNSSQTAFNQITPSKAYYICASHTIF